MSLMTFRLQHLLTGVYKQLQKCCILGVSVHGYSGLVEYVCVLESRRLARKSVIVKINFHQTSGLGNQVDELHIIFIFICVHISGTVA